MLVEPLGPTQGQLHHCLTFSPLALQLSMAVAQVGFGRDPAEAQGWGPVPSPASAYLSSRLRSRCETPEAR